MWAPLPPDRSAVPVLLYHGIGPESDFSNAADASYGVGFDDFAKQMTMIKHAGYQTIDLQTFLSFVAGRPGRASSEATAADLRRRPRGLVDRRDGILQRARLQRGHVRRRRPRRGRRPRVPDLGGAPDRCRTAAAGSCNSTRGRATQIKYGPGPDDYRPFYAYEKEDEDFDGWRSG